ncbi:MAG: ATP-binding protein [Bacteroidales bacterium]|nr:ATP-binding protein [Bacteroidales bacterium]
MSYRNRIAKNYIAATATLFALVFILIYIVVHVAVYSHLDNLLKQVAEKHANEVLVDGGKITFINKDEWEEREHREVEVNPVFIEVHGLDGKLMDRSPNLKADELEFDLNFKDNEPFNTILNKKPIRQIKVAIKRNGQTFGYISVAVPVEGYFLVLNTLRNILLVSFTFSMLLLFLVARYLAGKSIQPVQSIIESSQLIQHDNLNERIPVPVNRDELFHLASSINDLLTRIESSLMREKQFTANAAHQLKTPLAVMKGTFEVLLRKPRENDVYIAKINEGIIEIDRMSKMVDQLLLLARVDSKQHQTQSIELSLVELIDNVVQRISKAIMAKDISVIFEPESDFQVVSDPFLLDLIIENLITNALKYSQNGQQIEIILKQNELETFISIKDKGIGIRSEELQKIFNPFYRADAIDHPNIKGHGLGLSIVQRACRLALIDVDIESKVGIGTIITLTIKQKQLS